jgi:hypothetical protein
MLSEANSLDLNGALRQSSPKTPLLVLYLTEKEVAEKTVMNFAAKKQLDLIPVSMSGPTHAIEKATRKCLMKAMATVCSHPIQYHGSHSCVVLCLLGSLGASTEWS